MNLWIHNSIRRTTINQHFIRTCKYLDNKYYLSSWLLCSRLLGWIPPKVSMMVFNAIISFSGLPVGRGPKEVRFSKCLLALLATNPIIYQNDFRCIEYCIEDLNKIKIAKGAKRCIFTFDPRRSMVCFW